MCHLNASDSRAVMFNCHSIEGSLCFFLKALDILHAERIGHGYHVLEDNVLYQRIINEGIHLEVSKIHQNK